MPPMWAWNRSIGSKLSRRTLASKFTPPVVKPPILQDARACTGWSGRCSVGNWSVSQPSSWSPVLASIEPSAPAPPATSSSCFISWPASVAWLVSRFSLKCGSRS